MKILENFNFDQPIPVQSNGYNELCDGRSELNERNDCAVVAVSKACGVPYKEVHRRFLLQGRPPQGRTKDSITKKVIESLGFTLTKIEVGSWTVSGLELELSLRGGTYIIRTRGHLLTFSDGRIQDWTQGRRHRPKEVYLVTPRE